MCWVHNLESERDENAMRKLTGLQKQIVGLYRGFLRAARSKAPEERERIEALVSAEFRRNATQVDRKSFVFIEYLLRRGTKQLEQLNSPHIVSLSTTVPVSVRSNP